MSRTIQSIDGQPARRNASGLGILWVVGSWLLIIYIVANYGPKVLERYETDQTVRFSQVWFSVQNTSQKDWEGAEVTINGEYHRRIARIPPNGTMEILYGEFKKDFTLKDIKKIEIRPDGFPSRVHIPPK